MAAFSRLRRWVLR